MSKLTDEQIDRIYTGVRMVHHDIDAHVFARAIEAAATEPLLQRIAELEENNRDLSDDVQRFRKHAMNEKAARLELERQLEEARNQVLEEAANAVDAMKAPDRYGIQEQSLYDVATMEAADVVRALKGAKE